MALNSLTHVSEDRIVYWVLKTALILFFISDVINRVLIYYDFSFSVSLYIRGLYELLFILLILGYNNRNKVNFLLTLLILFFSYIIGLILFRQNYPGDYNISFHLSLFNKYVFVFIIFQAISKLENRKYLVEKLIKILENIFVINSLIVLLGAVFQIDLLRSYPGVRSFRFGYIGFIPAVNEATLFYLIAISLSYYRRYILGIKSYKFVVIVLASLLLGTKAIYVIIVSFLLLHIIRTSSFKTKFNVFFIATIVLLAVGFYFTTEDAQIRFQIFYRLANEYGIMSMLLSSRDILLKNRFFANMDYWGPVNYLLGGQNQLKYLIEMDFFDLFLLFGSLGSVIYLSLFFTSLFTFRKNRFFNLFFILIYFAIAALGGHFFASALNALYLALLCLYINSTQKSIYLPHQINE